MSYLKIYPKRIIATLATDGVFEGVFTLLVEQYGLEAIDKKCDVKIYREEEGWKLTVQPITGVETPQFKQFVDSLSHYLFSVSKFNPSTEGLGLVDYFFDDVYFDLSGQEPVIEKIPSAAG